MRIGTSERISIFLCLCTCNSCMYLFICFIYYCFWIDFLLFFQDSCLLESLEDGLNALLSIEVSMMDMIAFIP